MELNIRLNTSPAALHTKAGAETASPTRGASALAESELRTLARMAAGSPAAGASTRSRVATSDAAALERHVAGNPAARELAGRTPGAGPEVQVNARIAAATRGMAREGAIATAREAIDRATARPVGPEYIPPVVGASARAPVTVAAAMSDVMRSESAGSAGDYAFLDDPSLSTREKVMMFIGRQLTGIENDMQRIMRQKAGAGAATSAQGTNGALPTVAGTAQTATSTTPGASGAGGAAGASGGPGVGDIILGVVGGIVGAIATAFAGPVGGLAVGAATSAIGALIHSGDAPATGAAGGAGAGAGAGTTGGAASATPGSYTSTGGSTPASGAGRTGSTNGTPSEGETNMQLQSLVNRQQQMMTMASNVLSSLHQTAMTPLNNMRG